MLKGAAKAIAQRRVPALYRTAVEARHQLRLRRLEDRVTMLANAFARAEFSDLAQPQFRAPEFSVYSQNGEDGVLLSLFSRIGTKDRRCVEIGGGIGSESMTANLTVNWGWSGLVIEGSADLSAKARRFFSQERAQVEVLNGFVTAENVQDLLAHHGFSGKFDLLTIDVDGNDYWIWRALDSICPRVIVVEYNASFGLERSVTVPYRPDFAVSRSQPWYHGASLRALTTLASERGYSLVGCDGMGVNAFFVNSDAGVPPIRVEDAWRPHRKRLRLADQQAQEEAATGDLVSI